MNIYKILFVLIFIWCSVYNISLSKECLRLKNHFSAINSVLFQLISTVLCAEYIFR